MTAFIDNGDDTITFVDGELSGKTYRRVSKDTFRIIEGVPYQLVSDKTNIVYTSMRVDVSMRRKMYQEFMSYLSCLKAEECILPKTAEQLHNMMSRFYEFTQEPE